MKKHLSKLIIQENKENEVKLMTVYSNKYKALKIGNSTTMIIPPEGGQKLIEEFLNR